MSKTLKYGLIGVAVDLGALLALFLYALVFAAFNYNGRCGLGGLLGTTPCNFLHYAMETTIFTAFILADWLSIPLSLLLLASPPLGGIIIGRKVDNQSPR